MKKNLTELNLKREWLDDQLNMAGIKSVEEVFYAEIQTDGTLHIEKREDVLQSSN